jgi:hypothetical protein
MDDAGNSSITVETITKTISDIALEKLKNDMMGFYSLNFLLPSPDKPTLKAEAGISLGEWMKLTLWGEYNINAKSVTAGARIGGEFKI